MKKLHILSGIIIFSTIITINAMDASQKMDALIAPAEEYKWIDWQAVFTILDSMKDDINANEYRTTDRRTLLEVAVKDYLHDPSAGLSIIQKLLETYKADPNIPNRQGRTVIEMTKSSKPHHIPLINLLLKYGAKPTSVELVTYKTIAHQKELARPAIYKMIDPLVIYKDPLDWPAIFAILDSMQGTIDVNEYRTPDGDTLLKLATKKKNFQAMKILREKYGAQF